MRGPGPNREYQSAMGLAPGWAVRNRVGALIGMQVWWVLDVTALQRSSSVEGASGLAFVTGN